MLIFIWPYALYKMGKFSEAVGLNKFPKARDQAGIPDVWRFQLSFYTHSVLSQYNESTKRFQWTHIRTHTHMQMYLYTHAHTHNHTPTFPPALVIHVIQCRT